MQSSVEGKYFSRVWVPVRLAFGGYDVFLSQSYHICGHIATASLLLRAFLRILFCITGKIWIAIAENHPDDRLAATICATKGVKGVGMWIFGFLIGSQFGLITMALFAAQRIRDCEDCPKNNDDF